MRFKSRFFLKDHEGEERVVLKFLWWPRCFGHEYWRWLEYAFIIEKIIAADTGECGYDIWKWVEVDFDD